MTAPLEIADPAEMADALAALAEPDRRALTPLVRAADPSPALAVAGAACLPRAADVVSWLRSPRFDQPITAATTAAIVRVITLPGRPKAAAIATGLATKLRVRDLDADLGRWRLAAAALRAAGGSPPATEPMVRGWVRAHSAEATSVEELTTRLAGDDWSSSLLPQLFELPHVAADLDDTWAVALVRLAADGPLPRPELLRLVLRRLREGDRSAALRPVIAAYRLMDPAPDDLEPHRGLLLEMLGSQHVPVAEIGQQGLRALDEAGRLPTAAVREAAERILARGEKKLARAQLSWLEGALTRHADAAGPLLDAITRVLTAGPPDLAAIALRLLRRHPEVLRPAAEGLTGYLRRMADEALDADAAPAGNEHPHRRTDEHAKAGPEKSHAKAGPGKSHAREGTAKGNAAAGTAKANATADTEKTVAAAGTGKTDAAAGTGKSDAERMPPIEESAAVAAHLAARLAAHDGAPTDLVERERLLAGVVAYADLFSDPDAIRALAPTGEDPDTRMLAGRLHELADQLAAGTPPPVLLATPHTTDGRVDPARVLFRLAQAEQDGWQPGAYDLTQALLRLPPHVDQTVVSAAGRLTSPAGRRFAAWLRGETPKPERTAPADLRRLVTALTDVMRAPDRVR